MNRPVVLAMRDHDRKEPGFFATLLGLNDSDATFAVGSKITTVALTALADQWSGNYFLLWRKPPEARLFIQRGERGPAVLWLNKQLALFEGKDASTDKDSAFDDAMIRRVRQFQLSQDLEPIGVIGPKTLIRLAGLGNDKAPKLAGSGDR